MMGDTMKKIIFILMFIILSFIVNAEFNPIAIDEYTTKIDINRYNYVSTPVNIIGDNGKYESCDKALTYEKLKNEIMFKFGQKNISLKYSYSLQTDTKNIEIIKDNIDNYVSFEIEKRGCSFYYTQNIYDNEIKISNLSYIMPKDSIYVDNVLKKDDFIIDFNDAVDKQNINIEVSDNKIEFSGVNVSKLDPTILLNYTSEFYADNTDDNYGCRGIGKELTVMPGYKGWSKFNISKLYENNINSIDLVYFQPYLKSYIVNGIPGIILNIYHVYSNYTPNGQEWSETNLVCDGTYPVSPMTKNESVYYSVLQSSTTERILFLNITNLVRNSYSRNDKNITLEISSTGESNDAMYLSELNYDNISQRPYINITYTLDIQPNIPNISWYDGINKTKNNVTYNISLVDTVGNLHTYIISNNMSGIWQNSTSYDISSYSTYTALYSFNLSNATRGKNVCFKVYVNDTFNQWNESTVSCLNVVNTNPSIPNILLPLNTSTSAISIVTFEFNSSDEDNDNIIYYLFVNTTSNPSTLYYNGSTKNFTKDGFIDGTYYWTVIASDSYENSSNSSIYQFTISTSFPAVNLVTQNNKYFNTTIFNLTFNGYDGETLKNCSLWTNVTGVWGINQTNISTPNSQNINFSMNLSTNNIYKWNVQCYDQSDNPSFTGANYTFIIDTIPPIISITEPSGTKNSRNNIIANYMFTEKNPNICYYNVYRGINLEVANTTIDCNSTLTQFSVTLDADYIFYLYQSDLAGFINSTLISFSVDISTPPTVVGGGGGATPPTFSNKICNINVSERIIIFNNDDTVKQLIIYNNENYSITPIYNLDSDYFLLGAQQSFIQSKSEAKINILRKINSNETFKKQLIISIENCNNTIIELEYNPSLFNFDVLNSLIELEKKIINKSLSSIEISGIEMPIYIIELFLLLMLFFTYYLIDIKSVRTKIIVFSIISIFLNIILYAYIPVSIEYKSNFSLIEVVSNIFVKYFQIYFNILFTSITDDGIVTYIYLLFFIFILNFGIYLYYYNNLEGFKKVLGAIITIILSLLIIIPIYYLFTNWVVYSIIIKIVIILSIIGIYVFFIKILKNFL